jgi:hypothetical protein
VSVKARKNAAPGESARERELQVARELAHQVREDARHAVAELAKQR